MNNNVTELVFILDRSGSMSGLEADTIGGFNSLLEKQKRGEGKCLVTTVLFDHEISTLHDRVPIGEIAPLTREDYTVRGCTALLDAVGGTVKHIASIHKYARPEDVPEHTLFVITTDGMENASRFFTKDAVKKLIEHEKQKYGWEFLFLGANIDAAEVAGGIGVGERYSVNYHADSIGTGVNFGAISDAVSEVRAGAPLGSGWKRKIEADFKSRKK